MKGTIYLFYTFYEFYRNIGLDGIIIFAFLSATLYLLCGPKSEYFSVKRYTMCGTITYIAIYMLAFLFQRMPSTSALSGPSVPYWYYFLCTFSVALLWAYFTLKSSFVSKLTYTLFFVAFVELYKTVCGPLYLQEPTMPKVRYAVLDLLTALILYILLFLLTLVFRKFKINPSVQALPKGTLLTLYFPLSFLIGLVLCNTLVSGQYAGQVISAILLTNMPLIYYVLSVVVSAYEEQRGMDAALAQTRAELAGYQRSAELREQLRKERHELKNRYFYIQTLLREQQYSQLDEYLEKITGEALISASAIETGNVQLDYLLNSKIDEARSYGIKTCTEVALPKNFPVESEALFTILSNLLDNAIEASQKEPEPDLHIAMRCVQNYFICKISNRISRNVLVENPALHTTKEDATNHGFGMKVVRTAIEQCNGIFDISMENSYFIAKVMFPMNDKTEWARGAKGN